MCYISKKQTKCVLTIGIKFFVSSTGIFYQAPVDFYARRCQISHTALLIYQPPSFIERLACFIKMRTLSANCAGKLRNNPVTWLYSQPITARYAQQFAFYRFAISQFADYPPPILERVCNVRTCVTSMVRISERILINRTIDLSINQIVSIDLIDQSFSRYVRSIDLIA